jgi:hypothetical protein
MILAFSDHAVLKVLELDLDIDIFELICASGMVEPFLCFSSNQLIKLDVLHLLELGIVDDLDVLEGEGHFPLLSLPFSPFFLRNHFPVPELPGKSVAMIFLILFSDFVRLEDPLVVVFSKILLARFDIVLKGVVIIPGDNFLVDGFRKLGLGILFSF